VLLEHSELEDSQRGTIAVPSVPQEIPTYYESQEGFQPTATPGAQEMPTPFEKQEKFRSPPPVGPQELDSNQS
jgi:hypothetical protein